MGTQNPPLEMPTGFHSFRTMGTALFAVLTASQLFQVKIKFPADSLLSLGESILQRSRGA